MDDIRNEWAEENRNLKNQVLILKEQHKKEAAKLRNALQILKDSGADASVIEAALTVNTRLTHKRTGIDSTPICGETSYTRTTTHREEVDCPLCKALRQ